MSVTDRDRAFARRLCANLTSSADGYSKVEIEEVAKVLADYRETILSYAMVGVESQFGITGLYSKTMAGHKAVVFSAPPEKDPRT